MARTRTAVNEIGGQARDDFLSRALALQPSIGVKANASFRVIADFL